MFEPAGGVVRVGATQRARNQDQPDLDKLRDELRRQISEANITSPQMPGIVCPRDMGVSYVTGLQVLEKQITGTHTYPAALGNIVVMIHAKK